MRRVKPEVEQQRPFEHELIPRVGDGESVQQPFDRVAADNQIKVLATFAGALEQSFVHAGGPHGSIQVSASRYGRMTFATRFAFA